MATAVSEAERRDEFVGRLFAATIEALDLFSVYIGDRLGLYRALAEKGPLTPAGLVSAAGIHERYAREWLEQQAASSILEVDDAAAEASDRRYRLPAAYHEVLLDELSLNYAVPFGQLAIACVRPIDALVEAFRTGDGVPYADYGADLHEGQARFSRPLFENVLAQEWLPAIPEVHARLREGARVADVACGEGRSSIAIARAYSRVHVDGIDSDRASIEAAERHLVASDVGDRVTFQCRDAADPELRKRYDVVTIFEALHDMSYPVAVLRALRELLADGGSVVIADERSAEEFAAPAEPLERLYYGFSVLHCLPVGMVGENAAGTGTVMRPATVRRYAEEAGFSGVEVLPVENDFFRLYRLTP